jgi:hypothetical protein
MERISNSSLTCQHGDDMEWTGAFTMGPGIYTMVFSKVQGKYASESIALALLQSDIDLPIAAEGAKMAVEEGQDEHCAGHDDHRRAEEDGHACMKTVKQGEHAQ